MSLAVGCGLSQTGKLFNERHISETITSMVFYLGHWVDWKYVAHVRHRTLDKAIEAGLYLNGIVVCRVIRKGHLLQENILNIETLSKQSIIIEYLSACLCGFYRPGTVQCSI